MIIVGVDGSATSRAAVKWAAGDAFRMRLPLRIVHAVDPSTCQIGEPDLADTLRRRGQGILRESETLVQRCCPAVEVTTQEAEGAAAAALRELAEDAIEIVVGRRGLGGFNGLLPGSVSVDLAGRARCPVVVVSDEPRPVYEEIVVGVNSSQVCEPALAYAFEQARLRGARLRAVHAFAPEAAYDTDEARAEQRQVVHDRLEAFREEYVEVTAIEDVRSAQPVDALAEASERADLLVVGSHGLGTGGSRLFSSVSRGVLFHARCSVAAVHSWRPPPSRRSWSSGCERRSLSPARL
ncbi:universal stress protein [Nonomuraea sp. NPDC005650]|uniref:universal stress protein n=1 Tax=Nonomuraea sp. NPDC005650 TaxID=3157045 RepID=UPI0033ACC592